LATDVLVLGAGGAGLRAALAAAQAGSRVTLVSKLGPDEPNCTVTAWGGLTYCPDGQRDELFRQVVETGGFLSNQHLVEVLVRDTPERMRELATLGVPLEVLAGADAKGCLGLLKIPGQGRSTGLGLTRPLRAAAEAAGVLFLDRVMAVRLVRHGSRMAGVLGVRLSDGVLIALSAKAVIVATGGGACLYGRTDNPAGTTADGIALAYHAGAELVDMECVSFFLPEARLAELFAVKDPPDEGLLQAGGAHYFLGGIRIDARCRTTIPGLFAAGEVTGGLFGAARLGGSAMAETIVFGALAGHEAAQYARRCPVAPIDPTFIAEEALFLDALRQGQGPTPEQFAAELAEIMWRHAGTMKTAQTLRRAAMALGDLGLEPALSTGSGPDLRQAIECCHLLSVARVIVTASLLRQETRGCFWRLDFPQPDNDAWVANIFLWQDGDRIAHAVRPAAMTRLTVPTIPRIGAGCFPYLPCVPPP
jgi:succinate dehydrogenase/fumarate reductase flavoprotein subunit